MAGLIWSRPSEWNRLPMVMYALMSTAVLWDLLLPGYIFALDMSFTPRFHEALGLFYGTSGRDSSAFTSLPYLLFLQAVNEVLPGWLIQKILLFLVFFNSGYAMHTAVPCRNQIGRFYSGVLYLVNPFVFTRYMVGHLSVLLAYSIMPFVIISIWRFVREPKSTNSARLVLVLTLLLVFDSTILLIAGFVFLIFFIYYIFVQRRVGSIVSLLKWTVFLAISFAAANLFWIVPLLLFKQPALSSQVGLADLLVFTARNWGTGTNVLFSLAALYGFWRAPEGYQYVSSLLPGWQFLFAIVLFVSVYGYIITKEEDKKFARAIALIAVVGLILASGISTQYFSPLFEFLFNNIFFLRALREPQKLVLLLAFAYAILGSYAVSEFYARLTTVKKGVKKIVYVGVLIVILSTPFAYSFTQFGGSLTGLKLTDYPEEWYIANTLLNSQNGTFAVLSLPWHQFMSYSFTGRVISNPSLTFFDRPVISGQNIEVGPIRTQSTDPIQRYIEFVLSNARLTHNMGALLAPLNVKYVMLFKEADYASYDFLSEQLDLYRIIDNNRIAIFENTHYRGPFYTVSHIRQIERLNDLVNISNKEPDALVDSVFSLKFPDSMVPTTLPHKLKSSETRFKSISPTEFTVEFPTSSTFEGVLVFADRFNPGWKIDGMSPFANMGTTNAYSVQTGESSISIKNETFSLLVLSYVLSLGAGLILAVFSVDRLSTNWQRRLK